MGAACCCLRSDDYEDYANPNSSVYRNCICVRSFVQHFLNAYSTVFQSGEVHPIPSSTSSSQEDSIRGIYRSPPRPLPYDADPSCFHVQRRGLVLKHEKGTSHSHEESEPLRRSEVEVDSEYLGTGNKWKGSKENLMKSSSKPTSVKTMESWYFYTSSEEEDVCPTCLEEYTPENPKIMTKCSHHYHLGCIYEWKERSENCPVCGKVMEFDAMT